MVFLDAQEIERRLDFDKLLEALAMAMANVSSGAASIPPRIAALVEPFDALLGAMPAYVPSLNVLSAKLVALFPRNVDVPTHQAVIIAFDPSNGTPLAVMDGTYITAFRTAACSALATKLLSREDSTVLAILATGVQALFHARAMIRVRPISKIVVAGRNSDKAAALASRLQAELEVPCMATKSWEEAHRVADIVCATVHPHEPVVRGEWLRPGMHVNSVGVSTNGAEVDQAAITRCKVYLETRAVAESPMPSGSMELFDAVKSGLIRMEDLTELGEVVSGSKAGRTSLEDITLYKSVGIAAQDAAAVAVVLGEGSK